MSAAKQALDPAAAEAKNAIRFLRDNIDAIDLQLVALLVQRARFAVRIGEIKEYSSLPVVEPSREQQVLERVEKLRSEPLDAAGLERIFTAIMVTMRDLQTRRAAPPLDAVRALSLANELSEKKRPRRAAKSAPPGAGAKKKAKRK